MTMIYQKLEIYDTTYKCQYIVLKYTYCMSEYFPTAWNFLLY